MDRRLRVRRRTLRRVGRTVFWISFGATLVGTVWYFVTAPHPDHLSRGSIASGIFLIATAVAIAVFLVTLEVNAWWGVGALAYALFVLILNFATWYLVSGSTRNWGVRLTHTDALLITLGNLTTAGTAGLTPQSEFARRLVVTQLAIDIPVTILLFGLFVTRIGNFAVEWVREERRMRGLAGAQSSTAPSEGQET